MKLIIMFKFFLLLLFFFKKQKVIEIENKLVEVNGWRGDEVHETRRAQFDLLQAIASEAVDISHINKLLLSQLSQLDPKKPEDQLLIMTIASIVRYSKTVKKKKIVSFENLYVT